MQFGGMPELIHIHNTEGKKQYLTGIMNTIFMKDIVKRYAIKDVSYLEKVIAFLADIIGTEISLRNIYNISKQY
jgi:predicted AAA+ superfamily ATPase